MKTIKLLIFLVVATALVLVVLQNTAPVQIRFLWLKGEVPVILLLFLTTIGGFILGLIVALMGKSKRSQR